MSILLIDLAIFHAVAERLVSPDPHEGHFDTCFSLEASKLQRMVKHWYNLNRATHIAIHRDFTVIDTNYVYEQTPLSTVQFLKWLRCIKKNIDADIIGLHISIASAEEYAVVFLDRIIDEVQSKLIEDLAQCEEAANAACL
jgi:hypothetical protein